MLSNSLTLDKPFSSRKPLQSASAISCRAFSCLVYSIEGSNSSPKHRLSFLLFGITIRSSFNQVATDHIAQSAPRCPLRLLLMLVYRCLSPRAAGTTTRSACSTWLASSMRLSLTNSFLLSVRDSRSNNRLVLMHALAKLLVLIQDAVQH
jgi:hypothetical protein